MRITLSTVLKITEFAGWKDVSERDNLLKFLFPKDTDNYQKKAKYVMEFNFL
jgi:hypothetical protein